MSFEPRTIFAPAKINLGLRVTGRYANGYHHLESVFIPVTLYDRITVLRAGRDEVRHEWHFAAGASQVRQLAQGAAKNPLLWKSIAFAREISRAKGADLPPVLIIVHKCIPSPSGLGGASADAAALIATLAGFNSETPPAAQLLNAATRLGADVPFFLRDGLAGKCARLSGIGDELQPLNAIELSGLIVVPPFGFSTEQMFAWFRSKNLPEPVVSAPAHTKSALRLNEIPYSDERICGIKVVQNDFDEAARHVFPKESDALAKGRELLGQLVAQYTTEDWLISMTGSGAAFYAATEAGIDIGLLKRMTRVLERRLGRGWQVFAFRNHR